MINRSGYRILIFAVFLSLIWHIFWLSVVKIVSVPARKREVRFSKVSFLGPILERAAIELRVEPKVRSFLEKRYLVNMDSISRRARREDEIGRAGYYEPAESPAPFNSENLTGFIEEAINGRKAEPLYSPK